MPLIQANDLCVHFGDRQVLNHVNTSLHTGEIVTVIGPNGAGKSTLAKTLLGLVAPTHGSVTRQNKLRIGYMPQKLHVDVSLPITVERFIRLGGGNRSEALQAMEHAGINHLSKAQVAELSGGETQRLLLARALIRKPQLLVLDEPEQGMDVTGQSALYKLIAELRDELNCGVLLISHELHLVMASTDRVICLNQHICCQGEPKHIQTNPAYLELFGAPAESGLALYTHQHDHAHDIHGDIVGDHPHDHSQTHSNSHNHNHGCNHDHSPATHKKGDES